MKISLKKIACDLSIGIVALVSLSATAGQVNVDVNVIVPGVYQAPQPVYVLPRPVYVQPRPVYIQEQPVYVQEERYWDCKKDKCKHKKYKEDKHQKHDRDDD